MKVKIITLLIFASSLNIYSQDIFCKVDSFFLPKKSFNSTRFYSGVALGAGFYGTGTYFLYNSWYKDNGVGKFHFFDDRGEWLNMDKVGHFYTAYNQTGIMFNAARWTGLDEKKSLLFGMTMGMILQSTVEVLDGFSPKWGFSWSDMALNVFGTSAFYFEQKYWHEQKIILKVSSWNRNYNKEKIISENSLNYTTLNNRANELFGRTFSQRYLKDYNAQTYWVSFNLKSLTGIEKIPGWLNLAIGYSGENMFGGFSNKWIDNSGDVFNVSNKYERYQQFLIAPDIDFTRIKFRSHFLKSLFNGLNIFKMPTPALEINTKGEVIFHLFYK